MQPDRADPDGNHPLCEPYAAHKSGKRGARRKALQNLRGSLFIIACGVNNLAVHAKNPIAELAAAVAVIAMALWIIGSFLKARMRRNPEHPTGEPC